MDGPRDSLTVGFAREIFSFFSLSVLFLEEWAWAAASGLGLGKPPKYAPK